MLSALSNSTPNIDTISSDDSSKIFRKTNNEQSLYSLQHNAASFYDSNFEIANRAFYATINKFTKQGCQNKRTSYSFLENWHLHSIYSKSQQTLLGMNPVRPAVLLSGDDFMFTPPFIQQGGQYEEYYHEEEEDDMLEDEEEDDWYRYSPNEFYNLSPCPSSNHSNGDSFICPQQGAQLDELDDYNNDRTFYKRSNMFLAASYPSPTNPSTLFETVFSDDNEKFPIFDDRLNKDSLWVDQRQHHLSSHYKKKNYSSPVLSVYISSQLEQQKKKLVESEPEEPELSPCPSCDEQRITESSSESSIYSYCSSDQYDIDEEEETVEEPTITTTTTTRKPEIIHFPPQSSRKSLSDDASSIISYQSLADLIENESNSSSICRSGSSTSSLSINISSNYYGSTANTTDVGTETERNDSHLVIHIPEPLQQKDEEPSTAVWSHMFVYLVCFWQLLLKLFGFCSRGSSQATESSLQERQPLL